MSLRLRPVYTSRFQRDYKLMRKRGKDMTKVKDVSRLLAERKSLESRYRDHKLVGPWAGHRECHIEPDWLLVYKLDLAEGEIVFERTGSHADLFE